MLSPPRHSMVVEALTMARAWCGGHIIDGAPAICHAVRVVLKLGEHLPDAPPALVAAALVHDSPYLASPTRDLETTLTARLGSEVARVVLALHREHVDAVVPLDDPQALRVSAADKIVSLASGLRRAAAAADKDAYWRAREPFTARLPYLRRFFEASSSHLPTTMKPELGNLLSRAENQVSARRIEW